MTYNIIYTMAQDGDLQSRFIACAGDEGIPQPEGWVSANKWKLMSSDDEMVAQYEYGVGAGFAEVGKKDAIIPDSKILSVVQAVRAELENES